MSHVFISYRRSDSASYATRIWDALAERLGQESVFMDVSDIAPGATFGPLIEQELDRATHLIVVMAPDWISERLHEPDDFVRREIERAIERKIQIVPVRVGAALLPRAEELPESIRALADMNAMEIADQTFRSGIERLIEVVRRPDWVTIAGVVFVGTFVGNLLAGLSRSPLVHEHDHATAMSASLSYGLIATALALAVSRYYGFSIREIVRVGVFVLVGVFLLSVLAESYPELRSGRTSVAALGFTLAVAGKRLPAFWLNLITALALAAFLYWLVGDHIDKKAFVPWLMNHEVLAEAEAKQLSLVVQRVLRYGAAAVPVLLILGWRQSWRPQHILWFLGWVILAIGLAGVAYAFVESVMPTGHITVVEGLEGEEAKVDFSGLVGRSIRWATLYAISIALIFRAVVVQSERSNRIDVVAQELPVQSNAG